MGLRSASCLSEAEPRSVKNNISVGGWASTPFAAAYAASKFGYGVSGSLRQELANHPDVTSVEFLQL
jgi:short-subunit dehydrogenase